MHFYSEKLQRMLEFCVGEKGQLIPVGATALSGNIMFAWNNSSGNWMDQGWNNTGNWMDQGWNNTGNWMDQGWNNTGNWMDQGWSNSSGSWGDSGSGGGGCFITTACVEEKGLSDDCHEMNVLRKYRDILVTQDEEFRSKVLEYYRKAPLIIQGIESEGNSSSTYNTLYEVFNGNKSSKATLFLGKLIFDKTIDALEKNLKDIYNQISILPIDNLSKSAKAKLAELTKQKENLTTDIKKYKDYKKVYGNEIILSAHMIIEYGDKAWVLYAGNHNVLSETYVNYNTYYEHLKYCKEKGIKIYDQFGTIGDLSKDNPRLGLHEFKKKFGGDYVEFIGEFDLVTNKLMYFVFTKLVPIYRKLVRNRSKKELKHEISKSK